MPVTIHELLDELRSSALDERDKGDKFERLIKAYLLNEPEWTARFEDVWLWSEWPGRGHRTDTGIDLVAQRRDGQGLAAIQCKFYAADHKVSKADIDSFISASAKSEWTERYVFDTAAGWSGNAEETLEGVAQRVDISCLDDARVDWSRYSWSKPDAVELATKKQPHPYQKTAIDAVRRGLAEQDRGKLIMACGTGKTFTSLKIAEDLVGTGGRVLFLVPSIQLLSQTLREWMAQSEVDIRPFAVCSDVRVGRRTSTADTGDISTIDLTEPATTDAQTLVKRVNGGTEAADRMTVVFSTYQSIDVISQAQLLGLGDFDLVICDEAHRTTGVTLAGQDESHFVKVHDNRFIQASKRLYMTATPKVFDDAVTKKAIENDAVLADMNREDQFGPELHRLGFGEAVEKGLLTDYKVLVLSVEEEYVAAHFQKAMAESGEIQLGDASKILGCWNGLAKNFGPEIGTAGDRTPMRRAVAFAKDIRSSKAASAAFPALIDRALQDDARAGSNSLRVEAAHVDGGMGIHERNKHLDWLKAEADPDVCRVLTNARCLSEGVDVPALDAVMFLTPRGSQVDVVQSVGRVMRLDPTGRKKLGYIILPVVVPSGIPPEEALKDNQRYKVVWQVLQALRSHDDRFHAMVNSIELNKRRPDQLPIIDATPRPPSDDTDSSGGGVNKSGDQQLTLDYGFEGFRDAMYARIVKKVGERKYWDTWAKEVADIAQQHVTRINGLLNDPESPQAVEFDKFLTGLRESLNGSITETDAVDMLAQHLVTRPIFEALFEGYAFAETNPVAQIMERMLASLDEHPLSAENAPLESFYDSVRRRVAGVDNAEGKQKILIELYDKFFTVAFKKTVDKLGIVYTPVEIVDFILRSADDVLRQEFGQGLTDEGVHILDPFTGTGTFLVRLLQSGLIKPHDLARKYANELHANEILLLAYYIATVNIETTYADLAGEQTEFPGLVLTDTFQSWEPDDTPDLGMFVENNERLQKLKELPITVIIGNPPYRNSQTSANDDNANERYEALDGAIRDAYGSRSAAKSTRTLYDSYIRAIKWAEQRLGQRGIVAYVTNGSFLETRTTDGMRKALLDEFTSIYVFNLLGNQRAADWRRQGGKVFGSGSQTTVAVVLLVKNPKKHGSGVLLYAEVGDDLTAELKFARLNELTSVMKAELSTIEPDPDGSWISLSTQGFDTWIPLGGEAGSIATEISNGLGTSRDAWVYNFGQERIEAAMRRSNAAYERALAGERTNDPRDIKWSSSLETLLKRKAELAFDDRAPLVANYRPFQLSLLYPDLAWLHRPRILREFFPSGVGNLGYYVTAAGATKSFATLAVSTVPDLNFWGSEGGQFVPRWRYEKAGGAEMLDLGDDDDLVDGYRKIDNITDGALTRFQAEYPSVTITKDDIFFYVYGVLHSPEYRGTYASDLKKMLPRIPFVQDFVGFAIAGRRLIELHLDYEKQQPYPLDGLDVVTKGDPYDFFAVGGKKMRFGGTAKQKDLATIHYNERITVSGIPEDAYRYMLGSRSAIEWIIDRYYVKTDKASGIVNDPNDWSREVGDPRYILDLLARIVTVSVETMKIVDALPALDIRKTEREEGTRRWQEVRVADQ
ncbi:DEAD/DEAH box helicase [Nocardia thailandica]|uniref:DEAD/DEAH box helicase n=1 Tax=Nocardia thailandica TaxID=257275 RepID=UPI00031BEAEB|nr:type ISP restriction/modification enzyme [Nocardia thailandica]